jgi:hypothetical protein
MFEAVEAVAVEKEFASQGFGDVGFIGLLGALDEGSPSLVRFFLRKLGRVGI